MNKENDEKDQKIYCDRVWLNNDNSPSTGSIVCYHGPANWGDKDGCRDDMSFIEVSDCHQKARIHISRFDTWDQYEDKVRQMRDALNRFLEHLESSDKKTDQ